MKSKTIQEIAKLILYAIMTAVLLSVLLSCKKDNDGFTIYTVKAGHETCSRPFTPGWNKNSLDFYFKTNDSWLWTDSIGHHSYSGKAKIAGFSDGNHRKNSCRLGYTCEFGIMITYLFVEQGAQYISKILDTIQPNCTYHCRLSRENGYYVARMNGKEVSIKARKDKNFGYRLFPCMAGKYRQPKDWNVPIKWDN